MRCDKKQQVTLLCPGAGSTGSEQTPVSVSCYILPNSAKKKRTQYPDHSHPVPRWEATGEAKLEQTGAVIPRFLV